MATCSMRVFSFYYKDGKKQKTKRMERSKCLIQTFPFTGFAFQSKKTEDWRLRHRKYHCCWERRAQVPATSGEARHWTWQRKLPSSPLVVLFVSELQSYLKHTTLKLMATRLSDRLQQRRLSVPTPCGPAQTPGIRMLTLDQKYCRLGYCYHLSPNQIKSLSILCWLNAIPCHLWNCSVLIYRKLDVLPSLFSSSLYNP